MVNLTAFSLITIPFVLLMTGYRIGYNQANKFYANDPREEATPIYDALASDFPKIAKRLKPKLNEMNNEMTFLAPLSRK